MNKYAVFGSPIAHSKSPQIHNFLFEKFGIDSYYTRIVSYNSSHVLDIARTLNLSGFNATMPLKKDLFLEIQSVDEISKKAEAVNTVIGTEHPRGFNTDLYGVINTLKLIDLKSKKIAILGAGAAAETALIALSELKINNVGIFNRTENNIQKLLAKYSNLISITQFELSDFDIIISTIPNLDATIIEIKDEQIIFNADYIFKSKHSTNKNYISGLYWLINQALPAFELFSNQKIQTDVLNDLLNLLQNVNNTNTIYLIGFMGSGKSKIGLELSKKLNMDFIDLDHFIESRECQKISYIFNEFGEDYFRNLELKYLKELVGFEGIIACGGGILTNPESCQIIKNHGFRLYLYSKLNDCFDRTKESDSRPLRTDFNGFENLYNSRFDQYFANSDLIVDNSDEIDKIVNIIEKEIKLIHE